MLKNQNLNARGPRCATGVLLAVIAVVLCVLPARLLRAAEPAAPVLSKSHAVPETPNLPSPSPPAAIPLPDVAKSAMDVTNLLRSLTAQLSPGTEIEKIRVQLPGVNDQIDAQIATTRRFMQKGASLELLQMQQQLWQVLQRQMSAWLKTLTERATRVQDSLNQLPELITTWSLTRNAALAAKAPIPIIEQIDTTIAAINSDHALLQSKAGNLLDLQSRVASESTRCESILADITKAQYATVGGILERDRTLIWDVNSWERARRVLPSIAAEVADAYQADIAIYFHEPSRELPIHIAILAGLTLMLLGARKKVDRWVAAGQAPASSGLVFGRPYAAALTGALFIASGPYSAAPADVKQLLQIMVLLPMIRMIRPMVYPLLIPAFYVLVVLFAADNIRQDLAAAPLLGQVLLVFESVAGITVIGWFLHAGRLRRLLTQDIGLVRWGVFEAAAVFAVIIFAAGLSAATLGYVQLARLLSPGVLVFCTLALTLYAFVNILQGVAAFALRVWPLIRLRTVLNHRDLLERRFDRYLRYLAVFICMLRYLNYVGLLDPTLTLVKAFLAVNLGGAAFSTSIGGIGAFFLTVWGAYLFSRLIRFVLEEDVYPRAGLPIGLSYAMSSLLNYTILALGFIIAAGVLGVSMTQVTVLVGAFGVGIGFGLQSVVNNFVSGLILLFEQPIHVDDTIEVGDLLGKVRRIGMRASIVRTRQGSDIIVPNAQLVTEKVTNWTLNDKLRRIALPMSVNYGAAPREVIKILEETALAHPKVLPAPAPRGLMMGYGDSAINFELRAWTDEFDNWQAVRSDLAAALYDAVYAAGLTFPFPQREVRLLRETGKESMPDTESDEK